MGDLESFSVSEGSEGVDSGALDRLREQMKEAAAAMARDQKQEQKQKKQENNLYQVIIQLMNKLGANHPLVTLIIKNLRENILSEVILAVIALNYDSVQKAVGLDLASTKELALNENSLVVPSFGENDDIEIRFRLDVWIRFINDVIFKNPGRNLHSIKSVKFPNTAKHCFTDLMSYIAQEYLQAKKVQFYGGNIEKFMRLYSINLIERLELHLQNTKKIESNESN